jgi:hypothetical protein
MNEKKKDQDNQPGIHIEGGVHAGRDVIMGDQYNHIVQNVEQNPTPSVYISALKDVQKELTTLRQQPNLNATQVRNIDTAQGKVQEATEKASQPQPAVNEIQAALSEAKDTMDLLAGSILAAASLGVVIGNLIGWAGRVFGLF